MSTRFTPFDPDAISAAVLVDGPPCETGPGTSKPLSNHQKWKLSELAEAVYDFLRSNGELKGVGLVDWRHRIAIQACGQRISAASHGHYKLIQATLLRERGRVEAACRALAQAQATPLAVALFKLRELCTKTQTPWHTAETICRRFHRGASVADLRSPKQVWAIFYTIQNNANAAAGRGSPTNRFKSRRRIK